MITGNYWEDQSHSGSSGFMKVLCQCVGFRQLIRLGRAAGVWWGLLLSGEMVACGCGAKATLNKDASCHTDFSKHLRIILL